jgi:hypothetical protein
MPGTSPDWLVLATRPGTPTAVRAYCHDFGSYLPMNPLYGHASIPADGCGDRPEKTPSRSSASL